MRRSRRLTSKPRAAAKALTTTNSSIIQPSQAPPSASPPPWRRILYEQQPYPDNYTPGDWLTAVSSYSTAPAESEYLSYRTVMWLTLIIATRASLLTLFVTVFYAITQRSLGTRSLLALDAAVVVVLLAVHLCLRPAPPSASASQTYTGPSAPSQLSLASVCLLCFLLLLVSPLLSTLTTSYSSDTIYLLVSLLSAAHLLSFDYSSINSPTTTTPTSALVEIQPKSQQQPQETSAAFAATSADSPPASTDLSPLQHPVSLNCALLLSLLLASRLSSPLHVSLLLLFSSLLFAVSPSQQQLLCRWSPTAHVLSTVAQSLLCCAALCAYASVLLAILHALCVLGVCVVCPWWLLRVQRYKRTIHGPWDYDDEPETSSENL
ncbi:hypothetical protein MMC34_008545 [Xylographa carneopallida]|nr:hypothetical protein [Xylographa carneopallida]